MSAVSIVALVVSGLGMLGAALVMYTKIVRHLTRLEEANKKAIKLATHVPGLAYRVKNIEQQLGIEPFELPEFFENGHVSEE